MSIARSKHWNALLAAALHVAFAAALAAAAPLPAGGTEIASPPVENAGMLTARRRDGTALGACPLRHTSVAVDVAGYVATVTVTQRFENPFPDPIEAVYTFPLSEHAAVDTMTMRVGERVIRGEIERREDARRIYEAARAGGHVAALLDQERPNVFTQSIANLMPGNAVEVTLAYVEPLAYADGVFTLAFPTVVGPRFVPGGATGAQTGTGWAPDTDRVPDASRVTPPVTPPRTRAGHDIDIAVEIAGGVPIGDITAPLHEIDVERPAADRARVRLRRHDEIPNRDFVLRWTVAGDAVRSAVLTHRTPGHDGYVTVVMLPPQHVAAERAAPKEIVFVVDRSGSQSGLPLEKAKETMSWMLDHLNPNDTFQIVDFGSTANVLFERPQLASADAKRRARAHIATLVANGGTMMAEAVRAVCAMPTDGHRLRIVTFMTDGYVGNDFEVLDLVRSLRATSRWFPFGTGNGVNRFLIDGMARLGGGEPEYVLLDDPGDKVAARFYRHIAAPVLTDVHVRFEGLDVDQVMPAELADVWAERPLVIHARYHTPGRGRVVLEGFQGGAPYRETLDVVLPEEATHPGLASMWARARVDSLLDGDLQALQRGTVADGVKEAVIAVALEHRLVTQFTSFVAVEDRVVNDGGRQRTMPVPVEMPDGVSYEGVFGADRVAKAGTGSAPIGAAASVNAMPSTASALADGDGALSKLSGRLHAKGEAATDEPAPETRTTTAQPAREVDAIDRRRNEVPSPPHAPRADVPPALTTIARAKLSAELLALVSGGAEGPTSTPSGEIRVRIVLQEGARDARRKLERAGLRLERYEDGVAIGTITPARLRRLLLSPLVARVSLASEQP